jgi:acyl carrier protein
MMTKDQFRAALEDLLVVPRGALRDDDSRETVKGWSSLADVQIMILLETELGIEDSETLEYERVGDLVAALEGRGAFGLPHAASQAAPREGLAGSTR